MSDNQLAFAIVAMICLTICIITICVTVVECKGLERK